MKSDYVDKIKTFRITTSILDLLDLFKKVAPSKCMFFLTFFLSIIYSSNPTKIWRIEITLNSILFYLIIMVLILGLSYFLNTNKKAERIQNYFFQYSQIIDRTTALYSFLLIGLIAVLFSLLDYFTTIQFVHLTVYFLYFYNIAYLYKYCNKYSKEDGESRDFHVKCISICLYVTTIFLSTLWMRDDALILTSVLWLSPFYIAAFLSKKNQLIFLLYRVSFFIISFFLSTTIFPYFFLISLFLIWIAKFYYLFRFNTRYPSFLNNYDNS